MLYRSALIGHEGDLLFCRISPIIPIFLFYFNAAVCLINCFALVLIV